MCSNAFARPGGPPSALGAAAISDVDRADADRRVGSVESNVVLADVLSVYRRARRDERAERGAR